MRRFLAESLYKEGLKSQFVHLFMSTLHFPNEELVDEYKVLYLYFFNKTSSSLSHSLFFLS